MRGAKSLNTLFRNSKHLSWTAAVIHGAKYCFGFPQRDIEKFLADDSDVSNIPHPESNVIPDTEWGNFFTRQLRSLYVARVWLPMLNASRKT